jgi:signal transduction histidine kinase/streptogramin lyase
MSGPGWQDESGSRSRRRARFRGILGIAYLAIPLGILLCAAHFADAQYGYETLTVDSGLPENEIRGITQTPDGYLWIATFNGLVRFDGVHITVFNRKTPGLTANQFGSFLQGSGGDLWLASVDNGLVRYHNGVFRRYGKQEGVPDANVNGVTDDGKGNVWVLISGRILAWDEASDWFTDVAPENPQLHWHMLLWDLTGFWFRQGESMRVFSRGRSVDYALPKAMSKDTIWGAALDQSDALWIETVDGRQARIAADNKSHIMEADSHPPLTITGSHGESWTLHVGRRLSRIFDFVSSNRRVTIMPWHFYEDRQGDLWIGTLDHGLYRLQKQSIRAYTKEQGLIDRDDYAIYEDTSGGVWIGAWHSGLSRFLDGRFTNYTMAEGLPNDLVTAVFEDREGRLWAGTHGGLVILDHGRFHRPSGPILPNDAVVQAICQDRQGVIWFGTRLGLARYENGVTRFLITQDGLAADDTHVLIEGANGDLWVGGYGGLTRIRNGQFTRWTEKDGLPSSNIWSLYEDSDGVLWIGTFDGGLSRLQNGRFTNYSVKDGLFDDGVFRILEDSLGYLWISCDHGIYRVSKHDLNAFASGELRTIASVAYGKIDGMLTIQCNGGVWPSGTRTRDGKLWFPTQDGVAVIDPRSVAHDPLPPSVKIESTVIDNVTAPAGNLLRIPPGKANIEIDYTALSFINAAQTHYKYRLEGLDPDWVDADSRRSAYYSHLPPGKYQFHVIAANSDGVWNNTGQILPITVLAPFYETWWFEMLMAFAAAGLVAVAWKYRVGQLQHAQAMQQAFSRQLIASQEAERKRIAAEMHDSLGQRLVVIKNLALFLLRSRENGQPGDSDVETIAEISEEASSAIEETREISYNLRPFQLDRLGLTKAVGAMIRTAETASGIHFTPSLDNIDDFFPEELRINFYRIVQESVANIMKHAQASEVKITVKRATDSVTLTIEDNGRGFGPEARVTQPSRSGFGLTGMAERARLLGGEFKVRSAPGRGTTVLVEFQQKGVSGG